ncbi:hypothetical protein BH23BAC3_BH23BAC3_08460 [soil metagenome]
MKMLQLVYEKCNRVCGVSFPILNKHLTYTCTIYIIDKNCHVVFFQMNSFGQKIRTLRETENLLLREVAAAIEIDQALLSKSERSERIATKKQVVALSDFFGIDTKKLLTLWLGEKIADEIENEEVAHDALKVAEATIKYRTNQRKNLHV